ncbi:Transcriptional regulator STP4 [Spathaspora sp. JA1]|nr:Transcriptional regulator STP4 [Spathaspora sp. JA1]
MLSLMQNNMNSNNTVIVGQVPDQPQPPQQQYKNNSLLQYSEQYYGNNRYNSPSPTIIAQPQGTGFKLPSIHSLDIPPFPSVSQPIFQQQKQIHHLPPLSKSPTLLIPKHEQQRQLMSPVASPYSNSDIISRSRSISDPPIIKSEIIMSSPSPLNNVNYLHPIMMNSSSLSSQFSNMTTTELESSRDGDLSSSNETPSSTANSSPNITKRNWKPRKKRQCPECKLFFSNLATHKSTHLKPTNRPHICKYCHRGFARPNDLFRHVKCHWKEIGSDKGQFKCPFKSVQDSAGVAAPAQPDHCCHNTGIFSRCDTFKNHLKAIHFQYPNGTKKDQRMKVNGKCRMCQQEFTNVDDWMVNHIEKNQCPFTINVIKKV